uniref:ABC transporter domain-containing protein n=1 Tax=Spongospora subterranea TaxID=70186 RepID=A0A0H5QKF4_9EUKA|eukprot:CRZ02107.1 hypothetical protein [Spongospora subterranea]
MGSTFVEMKPAMNGIRNQRGVTLSWHDLSYSISVKTGSSSKDQVQSRMLLNKVSGEVCPGQMVAILGSSGAGKTTLLNVLAGRIDKGEISGSVLANGESRVDHTWAKTVAFVEQDDLMRSNLTVSETLMYAAMLRLPSSLGIDKKRARVEEIISQLGLNNCANTRIGSVEGNRGVSGGERKRTAIGEELASDPDLLFLDEPTSGLDAFTAVSVLEVAKRLAVQQRKSIICTIHQPRTAILELFDSIILLAGGRVVFSGSVLDCVDHFTNAGLPCPKMMNPSDFWLDMITVDFRSEILREESQKRVAMLQDLWQKTAMVSGSANIILDPSPNLESEPVLWSNSISSEVLILLGRDLTQDIGRNPYNVVATLGQALFNIILYGFLFWQVQLDSTGVVNRLGVLLMVITCQSFGVVMPIVGVLPSIQALIRKERSAGSYRAISAFLSKLVTTVIQPVVAGIISCALIYLMAGLKRQFTAFIVFQCVMLLHTITFAFLGMAIGSASPSIFIGQTVAPMFITVMMQFAGHIVNISAVPHALRWIRFISGIRYTFAALSQNEFRGLEFQCTTTVGCFPTGENVLEFFFLTEFSLIGNAMAVAVIAMVYFIFAYLLFSYRTKSSLKLF